MVVSYRADFERSSWHAKPVKPAELLAAVEVMTGGKR